jgi:integrase
MLTTHVERYLALRRTLGYKLRNPSTNLRSFARFADAKGDTHARSSTAVVWATEASSPYRRHIRLRDVALLARFLRAEDPAHEIPANTFHAPRRRPLPYIYTPEEIVRLIGAASRLRAFYPLRKLVFATMIGLIAATGLRISEALDLQLDDILPDGVLRIRRSKGGECPRFVPERTPPHGRHGQSRVSVGSQSKDRCQHSGVHLRSHAPTCRDRPRTEAPAPHP